MADMVVTALIAGLVVTLVAVLAYALRLRGLLHRYGTFQCAMRVPGGHWKVGILLLGVDALEWYPRRSFGLRPKYRFARETFEVGANRPGRLPHSVIVKVRSAGEPYEAMLSDMQCAGLVAWVDSAPPAEEPLHF